MGGFNWHLRYMFPFRSFRGQESMVIPPMWKLRLRGFLAVTEFWLRNIFSTLRQRVERYRPTVAEEAFESWMHGGEGFAHSIQERIDQAKARGAHQSVRFLQDVLVSAHDFDSYPDNRRKRGVSAGYVESGLT